MADCFMKSYEQKLQQYMKENHIHAEHLSFSQSCHSVAEAAVAVNATPQDFVKNICMIDTQDRLIVAIVKGEDRVSTSLVGESLGISRPRIATPEEILAKTGYPCGGTPSFGYEAVFLVDPHVAQKEVVYTGGGSPNSLVKIPSSELLKANSGKVARIRK